MGQGRVELPTSRLSGVRSNHLSYWPRAAAICRLLVLLRRGHVALILLDGSSVMPRSLETESYVLLDGLSGKLIPKMSGL